MQFVLDRVAQYAPAAAQAAAEPSPSPRAARGGIIVVTKDPAEERPRRFRAIASDTHVVMSSRAWRDYDVPGSPYFVHVNGASGAVVGEGSAPSWDRVADLVAGAIEDAADTPARVTEALRAAGIDEGHPSLHPSRA